jgi:hypothetical protein
MLRPMLTPPFEVPATAFHGLRLPFTSFLEQTRTGCRLYPAISSCELQEVVGKFPLISSPHKTNSQNHDKE